jgi:hypothetical protein
MLNAIGLKYGLIGFGIYTFYVIYGWLLSLSILINPLVGFLLGFMVISLGIYSQVEARKKNGGFLDFTDTLQVYMVTVLIAIIGYYITAILIFNFIDPAATKELMRLSIEQSMGMMESMLGMVGQKDAVETMDTDVLQEAMNSAPNPFGPTVILSIIFSVMMYTIIGLISAAVIRKDEPVPFH